MSISAKKKAIYAGTFDPFTNGHFDIVQRSLKVFDELILLIASPPSKKPFLTLQERLDSLKKIFSTNSQVSIDSWDKLVVEYARQKNISFLVRGLRPLGDFESEFQMSTMNNHLNRDIETIFFMTNEKNFFISSSLVKELHSHGEDIERFVPGEVYELLKSRRS